MEKSEKNASKVAPKLRAASIKATNDRWEVTKEKRRKREEIMERWKAEDMATKRYRARGRISLSSKKGMRVTLEIIRI